MRQARRTVTIRTPWIDLGAALKLAGLVDTGGQAKVLIQGGNVRVNGARELRRGRKVGDGDTVTVPGHPPVVIEAPRA